MSDPSPSSRFWAPNFPFAPARTPIFYGWIIVAGATLGILFSVPGQTMGFTVFTEVLMSELGLSRFSLSLAYCVGTVCSGFTLPALGVLLDKWGARKMVVASALATGLVLFFLSQAAPLTKLLGGGTVVAFIVIGLGFYLIRMSAQGVLTLTSRNVMGKWFDQRRGLALAVSGIAVSFGFSFAPRFLLFLTDQYGYDGAWIALGAATILIMAPVGWLVFRDNPEETGLTVDGPNPPRPKTANPDMLIRRDFGRAEALGTFVFWVFNLSFAWFALYSTAFTFHIESIGKEFGFDRAFIIGLFIPMAGISVTSNLLFGVINSRVRIKFLLLVMNLAAMATAIGLFQLKAPWGIPAYVIGNGLTGGAFVCLSGIVWPRFFGRAHLGAIGGVGMSSMVIASGLGPPAFGWSFDFVGNYKPVLLASVFVPAILAVASFWADNPQRKIPESSV